MASLESFANKLQSLRKANGIENNSTIFIYLKKDLSDGVIEPALQEYRNKMFDYIIPVSKPNPYPIVIGYYDTNYEPTKVVFEPKFTTEEWELVGFSFPEGGWGVGHRSLCFKIKNKNSTIIEVYFSISRGIFYNSYSTPITHCIAKNGQCYHEGDPNVFINLSDTIQKAIEEHQSKEQKEQV